MKNFGGVLMAARFILTDYVEGALEYAVYDKLEDGSFAGRIPPCKGVVAFGESLRECEYEFRSTLITYHVSLITKYETRTTQYEIV
jgi:predicted RNase H-like HicB family nuclease